MTVRQRRLTGFLLIVVPILFNIFFTLLSAEFRYPDTLREPSGDILRSFDEGGNILVAYWYGFALTPALFLPAALLFRRTFDHESLLLDLAAPLAILASATQLHGLVRWPFVVPHLARTYLDPASSDATRAAALTTFDALHRYAGVAIGEQLGYLFTAAWTVVVAIAMLSSVRFKTWFGVVGIIAAAGIAIGMLEPAGIGVAGDVNAIAYIVWSLWLVATGVVVVRTAAFQAAPAGSADAFGAAGLSSVQS